MSTTDSFTNPVLDALATEVRIADIIIGSRVRKDFAHVPELAQSILDHGLIQPIVLDYDNRLIAGESRIRAHVLLKRETIRAVYRGCLSDAELVILEATENNVRKDLSWQERCLSVDKFHRLQLVPAMIAGKSWGVRETGKLLNQAKSDVSNCLIVADLLHKNDEKIWKCENLFSALNLLIERRLAEATAKAAKETITQPAIPTKFIGKPKADLSDEEFFSEGPVSQGFGLNISSPDVPTTDGPSVIPLSEMLIHADSVAYLRTLPADSFNHCITDWPYAIDMDNLDANNIHGGLKGLASVTAEHGVDANLRLQREIVPEIFRVLKSGGFFITWCDPWLWREGCDLCTAAGFGVQRWPLVWLKTSSCMNQMAYTNFTKNIEHAIVARKGVAKLVKTQPSSVWTGGNDVEAKALGHPFAKPFGLWNWLYDAVTVRGDTVLEPFAGRGSAVIPAIRRGLRFHAVETQKEHYDALVVNTANAYRAVLGEQIKFS